MFLLIIRNNGSESHESVVTDHWQIDSQAQQSFIQLIYILPCEDVGISFHVRPTVKVQEAKSIVKVRGTFL